MDPIEAFRHQAHACAELGSPMYAVLLEVLADDWAAGGPVREVLAGHEDDPGPSGLGVRLLGSIHRLVLAGRAPDLARYFPTAGGAFDATEAPAALLRLLASDPDSVREWLDRAPQTNEVGRSATLYGGLLHLPGSLPVRLFEIGASGGLNLRADHYAYVTGDGVLGDATSGVRLDPAWAHGPETRPVQIVERVGCDLAPIDAAHEDGRIALTAYVWPDQTARHQRLAAALDLAARTPVDLRAEGAAEFVRGIELQPGTVTVLWHSVMFQYLPRDDQQAVLDRVETLGAQATGQAPFAHLAFEPIRRGPDADHEFLIRLETWPGGEDRIIGSAPPHGLPVTWE